MCRSELQNRSVLFCAPSTTAADADWPGNFAFSALIAHVFEELADNREADISVHKHGEYIVAIHLGDMSDRGGPTVDIEQVEAIDRSGRIAETKEIAKYLTKH